MKKLFVLTKDTNHQTHLVWIDGYWDGPISGGMLWEGKPAYYEMFDDRYEKEPWPQKEIDKATKMWENGDEFAKQCLEECRKEGWVEHIEIRLYKVYRITQEEFDCRLHNTKLWKEICGNSWLCDENNRREFDSSVKSNFEKNARSYEEEKLKYPNLELTEDKLIGEFEE